MARRLIDGMVVNTSEEVGIPIEDVGYEPSAEDTDVYTVEEYDQALEAYNSAQRLLLLLQCEGFAELGSILQASAEQHGDAERRYTGLDEKKVLGLRMNRISADYALKFVTDLIENAQATPRPILQK